MSVRFIELRKIAARGTDSIAADTMRHLHARQHLGKAAVITTQPAPMLAAARKQWLKLSRALQKQRASTLHADKILKYTHSITHMQHMRFTHRSPLEVPDADVYFLTPDQLYIMPVNCWTVYIVNEPQLKEAQAMLYQLPADALVVDYLHRLPWVQELGLQPKQALEADVDAQWRQVKQFLHGYKIDIANLTQENPQTVDAMDDALDTLLGVSRKFLAAANDFQRALELARPLRCSKALRTSYDSLVILAHRVQALSPGVFTQQFLETYNEDDTLFLYDISRELRGEDIATAYARHMAAGRVHLAYALRVWAATQPDQTGPFWLLTDSAVRLR
ncbi:MAG TPA: hypothetical protein VLH86_03425 [Patescibacteria group bacterium]|nr:hypothetical protein [Patescibacteria group bacterium]